MPCHQSLFLGDCTSRICERSQVPHHYLWRWSNLNTRAIGKLIDMQKNGNWENLSVQAARIMAIHLQSVLGKKQLTNCVILPAPGRHAKDHAWVLASSLSRWTGLPLEEGLDRNNVETQKSKALEDRWAIRHSLKVNFTTANRNFILVDDVLTTGATVLAAKEALRGGNLISAVTLCWREKLRQVP